MKTTGLKRHKLRRRGKKRGDSRTVECKLTELKKEKEGKDYIIQEMKNKSKAFQ